MSPPHPLHRPATPLPSGGSPRGHTRVSGEGGLGEDCGCRSCVLWSPRGGCSLPGCCLPSWGFPGKLAAGILPPLHPWLAQNLVTPLWLFRLSPGSPWVQAWLSTMSFCCPLAHRATSASATRSLWNLWLVCWILTQPPFPIGTKDCFGKLNLRGFFLSGPPDWCGRRPGWHRR